MKEITYYINNYIIIRVVIESKYSFKDYIVDTVSEQDHML